MKKHEITTSKGEFVALRLDEGVVNLRIAKLGNVAFDNPDKGEYGYDLSEVPLGYKPICKLSEATEDDAKLIVEFDEDLQFYRCGEHPYINNGDGTKSILVGDTCPIKALYSLLKSKGIDINNGNWYLFKKI